MQRQRVVVTGLGTICPCGNTVEEAWQNIAAGRSGIGPITRFDPSGMEVHIAGEVKGFDSKARFGHREARRMDRTTQFALVATQEALKDSGVDIAQEDPYEVGCVIGSGVGGIETLLEQARLAAEKGMRVVSPLLIPMMLPDSPTGRVAIEFNLRGPNMSISTACATGNNAIGEAAEMIRRGSAQVMIAGSTEAGIVPIALAGFSNMGALTKRNDDPLTASRPFDATRDGFVMAEGAGIVVLESLEHAQARGARIYAEVLGYGTTDDAHHVTAPMENGEGARVAMSKALRSAGVGPEAIDYINAHGTSTPLNDASETRAIKSVWGEKAYDIKISSIKGVTGHMLGAASSVEAVISVMSLVKGFIPPTANLNTPDPDCDLDYTPNVGVAYPVKRVMSNSFGFGGHNAVLILGQFEG
ncbi:MAG: beta-ketoacyl-ACP synthase II [Anaerolineae bacterium]|nr:beta-ketoacyl-ACP synthase II [Anaerolineae bacterium]